MGVSYAMVQNALIGILSDVGVHAGTPTYVVGVFVLQLCNVKYTIVYKISLNQNGFIPPSW